MRRIEVYIEGARRTKDAEGVVRDSKGTFIGTTATNVGALLERLLRQMNPIGAVGIYIRPYTDDGQSTWQYPMLTLR